MVERLLLRNIRYTYERLPDWLVDARDIRFNEYVIFDSSMIQRYLKFLTTDSPGWLDYGDWLARTSIGRR
jgi:hypothetical protein